MKLARSIAAAALCACAPFAQAGVVQFDLSPIYNIDGVANSGDTTQSSLDQPNAGGNFVFLTQSLATSINGAGGDGLLDSGFYAATAFHPDMQLGYGLNPGGNNVRQFAGTPSVNLDVTDGNYTEIHVAAMSGGGSSSLALTLHYADGNVTTGFVTINDWFNNITETASDYYIHDVRDRIHPDLTGYENSNNPAIFGHRFLADASRQLVSIDFIPSGTSSSEPRLNIFGATGVTAVPEPGSIALVLLGAAALLGRRRRVA